MEKESIRRRDFAHPEPCPECGSSFLVMYNVGRMHFVSCEDCSYASKIAFSKEKALRKWNKEKRERR